jgi:ADP-ribose pyrophosphatase
LNFEEKTIQRHEIYKGRIIHVVKDEVELPNNLGVSKRELVFHPGGVVIIPITKEGKMVFVKQFRKPLEKVLLEIPSGKIELDEYDDLESAAKRELEEETGYLARKFYKLKETYMTPGFCNEVLHFYFATDLEKQLNPRPKDKDEVLEVYELTFEEAKQAEKSKLIHDAKTVIALQIWEIERLRGNLNEW